MANTKLRDFAEQLKKNTSLMFNVLNAVSLQKKYIDTKIDQAKLDESFGGSINKYIDHLVEQGNTKMLIEPRTKNGSSSKPAPFSNILITATNHVATSVEPAQEISNKTKKILGKNEISIDAFEAMKGFNAIEKYNKLSRKHEALETKLNEAEKERDSFKEQYKDKLRDFTDLEKTNVELSKKLKKKSQKLKDQPKGLNAPSPEALNGWLQLIQAGTPLIAPLISKAVNNGQGQQTATEIQNVEDFRQQLMDVAKSWPKEFIDLLNQLVLKLASEETGQQTLEQLQQLLNVQPLRKVENDG